MAHILRKATLRSAAVIGIIEFSLDFVPQVLYWIQIWTEGRHWHDSDVLLLEKVSGGSDSVGAGIVLLEHVMLVIAISRSSQCSTTGVTKTVVCVILSIG